MPALITQRHPDDVTAYADLKFLGWTPREIAALTGYSDTTLDKLDQAFFRPIQALTGQRQRFPSRTLWPQRMRHARELLLDELINPRPPQTYSPFAHYVRHYGPARRDFERLLGAMYLPTALPRSAQPSRQRLWRDFGLNLYLDAFLNDPEELRTTFWPRARPTYRQLQHRYGPIHWPTLDKGVITK